MRRERSRRIVHDGSVIGAAVDKNFSGRGISPNGQIDRRPHVGPVSVPGGSSIPGLDNLNANFVERLNSFRTLRTIAHESTGLSPEAASLQASEGAAARRREQRKAEGVSRSKNEEDLLIPHSERISHSERREKSSMDALAVKFAVGSVPSKSRRSASKSPERQSWEEAKKAAAEAERVAARLQQKGVSNVSVSSRPISTPMIKEATLRDPSPRSFMPRDERKIMNDIPLQFLEGRHEDAILAIMGFWHKYPPLVPPLE